MFAIPWHGHTLVGTTDTPIATPTLEPRPLRGGDRLHPRDGRPVPPQGADARRRAQRVCRDPAAREERRRQADGGAVARPHDPHRRLGPADDHRRQVDDVPQHGRAHRGPGRRPGAADRAALRDAHVQRARVSHQRGSVRRAERLRVGCACDSGPDARDAVARRRRSIPRCPTPAPKSCGPSATRWRARVEDVLARRTRALFLNARAAEAMAPEVARLMGEELGWDAARIAQRDGDLRDPCEGLSACCRVRRRATSDERRATSDERRATSDEPTSTKLPGFRE